MIHYGIQCSLFSSSFGPGGIELTFHSFIHTYTDIYPSRVYCLSAVARGAIISLRVHGWALSTCDVQLKGVFGVESSQPICGPGVPSLKWLLRKPGLPRNGVWGPTQHWISPHWDLGFHLTSRCLGITIPIGAINDNLYICMLYQTMSLR